MRWAGNAARVVLWWWCGLSLPRRWWCGVWGADAHTHAHTAHAHTPFTPAHSSDPDARLCGRMESQSVASPACVSLPCPAAAAAAKTVEQQKGGKGRCQARPAQTQDQPSQVIVAPVVVRRLWADAHWKQDGKGRWQDCWPVLWHLTPRVRMYGKRQPATVTTVVVDRHSRAKAMRRNNS